MKEYKLVVVESPSKAKTIANYLGAGYIVMASNGHVRNIPPKPGAVEPDKDFFIHYEIPEKSKKTLTNIERALTKNKCHTLYIATDPDREGEAIGWHIVEALNEAGAIDKKNILIRRISFNEITKRAVTQAIKEPKEINTCLVHAQQARSSLDYLIGFSISPILWRKLPGSRSAGRVQSVALRMICDREHEIDLFVPKEYHTIEGLFATGRGNQFSSNLISIEGKKLEKFDIDNSVQGQAIAEDAGKKTFKVDEIKKTQTSKNPSPPFITSTLQQEASRRLGFSPSRTMRAAQKLYEGVKINGGEAVGLITYMRTDGLYVSNDAIGSVREFVSQKMGKEYVPEAPREYRKKIKNAQEAHEAIRPTDVARTPDSLGDALTSDEYKLYELIWNRMVASQMASAKYDRLSVAIVSTDGKYLFRASGSKLIFDGFLKIYHLPEDDNFLDVRDSDSINVLKITDNKHMTEPPPRFSEASLIAHLEELGIGRPSTYASIINVLQDRLYVENKSRVFHPTPRGRTVAAFMKSFFAKYVEYDYTASLEEELDAIANGETIWKKFLEVFWRAFSHNVDEVSAEKPELIMSKLAEHLDYLAPKLELSSCSKCKKGTLKLRVSKHGPFLCCSTYPECNYSLAIEGNADNPVEISQYPKALGSHEGNEITLRSGPYGLYVQAGEDLRVKKKAKTGEAPKRISIPKNIEPNTVTLEKAIQLLQLPKILGHHPETGQEIKVGIGPFGPYINYTDKFISISAKYNFLDLSLSDAVDILSRSRKLKEGAKNKTKRTAKKAISPRKKNKRT